MPTYTYALVSFIYLFKHKRVTNFVLNNKRIYFVRYENVFVG